jgi:hypothetical protein
MKLKDAFRKVSLLSDKLITQEEFAEIIKNEKHYNIVNVDEEIMNSDLFIKDSSIYTSEIITHMYIPARNAVLELESALNQFEPNGQTLKTLKSIEAKQKTIDLILKMRDDRIRYVLYCYKYSRIDYNSEYSVEKIIELFNMALLDDNNKIKALGVHIINNSIGQNLYVDILPNLFSSTIVNILKKNLENKHIGLDVFMIIYRYVLIGYCYDSIQEKIVDLLLGKNNISDEIYDILFDSTRSKSTLLTIFPIFFFILENWGKYKKVFLNKFKLIKDDIIIQIESMVDKNDYPIEKIAMSVYCNSPNLEIRALAINFMINKWDDSTLLQLINKSKNLLNENIMLNILKSYDYYQDSEVVHYAKKWMNESNLLYASSCSMLGKYGGEEERVFLKKIAQKQFKDTKDVDVHILNAMGDIIKRQ